MLIINITFRGFYPHSKNSLFCALFWSNCAMLNCAIMNSYITSFLFAFTGPQQPLCQDERLIGDHRRPSVRRCLFNIVGQKAFLCVHKFWKLCSRAWYKACCYHVVTSRGGTSRRDQRTWPPKSEGKYWDRDVASIRIPQEVNQTERPFLTHCTASLNFYPQGDVIHYRWLIGISTRNPSSRVLLR